MLPGTLLLAALGVLVAGAGVAQMLRGRRGGYLVLFGAFMLVAFAMIAILQLR